MSYKTMQGFFSDALSVQVSTGFLAKQVYKASEALKQPYDKLVESLAEVEHLHSDETGSKENGERRWTWCLRSKDFIVYHISPSRGSVVLEELLGADYDGIISSDFFSAYRKFKRLSNAKLQLCWAHLIREVKFLAGNVDNDVSEWSNRLLEEIRKMFSLYHRRDSLLDHNWRRKLGACRESIISTACSDVPANKDARNLSIRLQDWRDDYFRFIEYEVPPTNNLCEQSIRRVVIDRKITQGTRSAWGNRWSERIWSVIATCEQRGENIMLFLRSCVGSFLKGVSPPSFFVEKP
jgi:transposase